MIQSGTVNVLLKRWQQGGRGNRAAAIGMVGEHHLDSSHSGRKAEETQRFRRHLWEAISPRLLMFCRMSWSNRAQTRRAARFLASPEPARAAGARSEMSAKGPR